MQTEKELGCEVCRGGKDLWAGQANVPNLRGNCSTKIRRWVVLGFKEEGGFEEASAESVDLLRTLKRGRDVQICVSEKPLWL
jgi:hypothetical protein